MKIGSHIYVDIGLKKQHGIYCGNNLVIYWSNSGSSKGEICSATLAEFSQGKHIKVRVYHHCCKSTNEVVKRAKRRLKESKPKYSFTDSKAFAMYCKTGLKIGDHIYVDCGDLFHHGIYYANDRVAHYYKKKKICITSLSKFSASKNRRIKVKHYKGFSSKRVLRRVKSRLGERKYNLISNNCEHFSAWCKVGKSRSKQLENLPKSALKFIGHRLTNIF